MRNAVVNSTPLIALHDIGRLDVLSRMYKTVYIHTVYMKKCASKVAFSQAHCFRFPIF